MHAMQCENASVLIMFYCLASIVMRRHEHGGEIQL